MNLTDPAHLQAALACLLGCAALGWFAPPLIARLPEPPPEPPVEPPAEAPAEPPADVPADVPAEARAAAQRGVPLDAPAGEKPPPERRLFERSLPPAPPKELYADLAALPRLPLWLAVWSGAVGAVLGLTLGWTGALLYLAPLAPVGVVLMVIDWRTTLLPTRIIHPTYLLLAVLVPLAALVDHDLAALYRAGWGWLVIGGWFWGFWWLLNAWGFGDVRLARVLGPALGYLGWAQLLMGLALIVFVGAFGGLVLALVRGSLRARVPYGPSMLVGALLAVLIGPWLARSLGY